MANRLIQSSGAWTSVGKKLTYNEIPTIQELRLHLERMFKSSRKSRLELYFSHERQVYVLVLEYGKQSSNAHCKFYRENPFDSNIIWERNSSDSILIHNLVVNTIENGLPKSARRIKTTDGSKTNPSQPNIETGLLANFKKFLAEVQHNQLSLIQKEPGFRVDGLIDLNFGRKALGRMMLTELGILSYPAFLFCLFKEFKSNDDKTPLTVLLFKLTSNRNGRDYPTPKPVLRHILAKIKKLQRKTDIIAQYDVPNTFAIMLPEADLEGGKYFASRMEDMLAKLSSQYKLPSGTVRFTIALATIGGYCNSVEKILGAADCTLEKIEKNEILFGTYDECFPKKSPSPKNINEDTVQNMVGQLIVQPYGIFSYPALIAFMEHQYERAKRKNRIAYVLIISLLKSKQVKEDAEVLEKAKFLLVQRLMSENNRFLLAEYKENSIAIIAAKASLGNLPNYGKQLNDSIADKPLSMDEAVQSYKIETKLFKINRDKAMLQMLKLSPAKIPS